MTAYTVASAILISSCFMNRHAFAAAQPVVANLMQGVQNAQTVYSAGQQAFASMVSFLFGFLRTTQFLTLPSRTPSLMLQKSFRSSSRPVPQ